MVIACIGSMTFLIIKCKFGHQVTLLVLVANLTIIPHIRSYSPLGSSTAEHSPAEPIPRYGNGSNATFWVLNRKGTYLLFETAKLSNCKYVWKSNKGTCNAKISCVITITRCTGRPKYLPNLCTQYLQNICKPRYLQTIFAKYLQT